ncbi:enoyl-CoA hydratase/isomerase domain-containing protein [Phthorimaea operculella]|nr:enoyl-CoA hydratase/isomerase domain-containing protein [Phthorimaea operculella]
MIPLRHIAQATIRSVRSNRRCYSAGPGALVDLAVDNDGICTLTMQRSPVNSLNLELLQDLNLRLDEVARDKIKGMVLTSAFPNVFSAGFDINEAVDPQIERLTAQWRALQDVWSKVFGSDFISTAAINGHSPAGGCVLALSCEYRVMVQNKKIGINDTIIGIIPPKWVVESTRLAMSSRRAELALTTSDLYTTDEALKIEIRYIIIVIIPPKWVVESAKLAMSSRKAELALTTSDMYTTDEALKIGLVDESAIDKDEAVEKCKKFIKKFDKIPSFARIATKKSVREPILKLVTEAELKLAVERTLDSKTQETVKFYFNELKSKKK